MEITIQVPDKLGEALKPYEKRLPEVLEIGLREIQVENSTQYQDENAILEFLSSRPTPQDVLALRATPQLQARISELIERSKQGDLGPQEEAELDRYFLLEHLVRLAKAHAVKQLA